MSNILKQIEDKLTKEMQENKECYIFGYKDTEWKIVNSIMYGNITAEFRKNDLLTFRYKTKETFPNYEALEHWAFDTDPQFITPDLTDEEKFDIEYIGKSLKSEIEKSKPAREKFDEFRANCLMEFKRDLKENGIKEFMGVKV